MSNRKKKNYKYLLPNLLETQRTSFCWFLEFGFRQELEHFFPLRDYLKELELNLLSNPYRVDQPKYSFCEAKRREMTYSVKIYTRIQLIFLNGLKETVTRKVLLCDIPLMTNEGTFLVNGVERIVINQIVRSPGIYYTTEFDKQNFRYYIATLISNRGTWIKFEVDKKNMINIKIDKTKKISAYILLKTIGLQDDEIFDHLDQPKYFRTTFLEHAPISLNDSFYELYLNLRPGEDPGPGSATVSGSKKLIFSKIFDPKKYDLGIIGRSKLNTKLNIGIKCDVHILTSKDILFIINNLINFKLAGALEDDIDHFSNRRVRSVGELLQNQLRIGLTRLERISQERMASWVPEKLRLSVLVNSKPLNSSISEFFSLNPLSQFMDQTNLLAELTHKRRLSVLGPGGITRDRAGFSVRDIHPSQYGRVCPIETPEGPNVGLIGSLSTYGRVNSFGFLETPFYKVKKGKVLYDSYPVYLDANAEEKYSIANGDVKLDSNSHIKTKRISVRYQKDLINIHSTKVDYIAVSPIQVVSLATALIPFLEHDDANRVLMGSNMQRQSVPLVYPEAPLVGTGLEAQTAHDSGMILLSVNYGKVLQINYGKIIIKDINRIIFTYRLTKYQRSNQETCINQRAFVSINEKIVPGQILADGPSTEGGELSVGQDVIIAYMPWEGYNYEDAFVVSERLLYDDLYTSHNIEKFEIEIRNTKLGLEEVTKDLPNANEHSLRNLDKNGIVKIGTWVNAGDILVGKITPKGESEYPPEAKLLRALLGESSRSVRNTSLKLSNGTYGRVLDIKIFSRKNRDVLPSEIDKIIKIYIVQARKIQIGDKMAGRHGNKGIISKILPRQDMPYLPDGTPVDMIINPLGVPSRMNVGQLFECLLGLAADNLNVRFKVVPFDEMYGIEASRALINKKLKEASNFNKYIFSIQHPGKIVLCDGRTGKFFENPITVGRAYMLKLVHQVEDKIHARSTGPYSLVTQQPLGGRAQQGGQRLGEMEVWALEAFGAAYTLQELLTIKSDDIKGRNETLNAIVKGLPIPKPGIPESFKVLIRELQALCLDVRTYKLVFLTKDN
jgi:DNA-directed RNA polymerase subunit beta